MATALRRGDVDAAVYDNTVVGDVLADNDRLKVATTSSTPVSSTASR